MKWVIFIANVICENVGTKIMKISEIIIQWYKKNQRDLPWRENSDPYRIWLSEIILQQTRVDQGLSYFNCFSAQYPDVHALAAAGEQEVMKLWQGLGYYSRARNLLTAARQVVTEYEGVFPRTRRELLQLKGVGEYTSAAVASIAFNEPVAVVDGNVARVVSRLFAVGQPVNTTAGTKVIRSLAEGLLDPQRPGDHNQAMMEFGALQCVPSKPNCAGCVLNVHCTAYSHNSVGAYPVKRRKAQVKKRFFTYLVIDHDGTAFLQQRTGNDIWRQLFEFPLIEHESLPGAEDLGGLVEEFLALEPGELTITKISAPVKHQLTHQTIIARFVHLQIRRDHYVPPAVWIQTTLRQTGSYPLPRLIGRYLEAAGA